MSKSLVPLCIPAIGKKEVDSVTRVLRSGWLTHGPKNEEFEAEFAHYIGAKYAVSLNSCTSALHLAILAQGITGEIILPSFTFVASANSIITAGAKPVFVDIDPDTYNLDPKKIEAKISDMTEAIMPVHFAGQSCQMDEIMKIARNYRLKVIEDSAETIGGKFKGKRTGTFGVGCFSFFPTKNITTGEGGMLTTCNRNLVKKAKAYAGHGIYVSTFDRLRRKKPWIRAAASLGYNFRMSNILAAIGVEQLKKIDQMNALRRDHAHYLNKRLSKFEEIQPPIEANDCYHVYQMYVIKLRDIDRTEFIHNLRQKGIGASVHFDPPVHLHPYYKKRYKYQKGNLPITEAIASSVVTLPMFPQLTKKELDMIVACLEKAIIRTKRRRQDAR